MKKLLGTPKEQRAELERELRVARAALEKIKVQAFVPMPDDMPPFREGSDPDKLRTVSAIARSALLEMEDAD